MSDRMLGARALQLRHGMPSVGRLRAGGLRRARLLAWVVALGGVLLPFPPAPADESPPASITPLAQARISYSEQKYDEALAIIGKLSLADANTPEAWQMRLLRGQCHQALGKLDDAVTELEAVSLCQIDQLRFEAFQALAQIHLTRGNLAEADQALRQATELYLRTQETKLTAAGAMRYFVNRAACDGVVRYTCAQLGRLASLQEQQGHLSEARTTYLDIYGRYPEYPGARAAAAKIAQTSLQLGDRLVAQEWFLQTLGTGADRCFSRRALLSENQWYLDEASRPPDPAFFHLVLPGLNGTLEKAARLDGPRLQALELAWHEAVAATYDTDMNAAERQWRQVIRRFPERPWSDAARLALAEHFCRSAYWDDAVAAVEGLARSRATLPGICRRAQGLCGAALLAAGRRPQGGVALQSVIASTATSVPAAAAVLHDLAASQALVRMAESAESALDLARAERLYRLAALRTPDLWQRQGVGHALQRLAQLRAAPLARGGEVSVLPDDRTTRGDWPLGYGREYYVLCGQNYRLDRVGGSLTALGYHFATGNPKEPSRLWVSQASDDDPAALWDPVARTNRSANRDDYGEQVPLGQGPDLLLSLDVPPGTHVLSLYFVNDHNYYEAKREYAVSVTDASQRLCAVTQVNSFGGGVYKRFAVAGPATLTFRIWRCLSMNVLLSGVFLDPLPAVRPLPTSVAPGGAAPDTSLRAEYAARAEAFTNRPLGAVQDTTDTGLFVSRVTAERRQLGPRSWNGAEGRRQLDVLWVLGECHRALGQHRRALEAFADYLAAVRLCTSPEQSPGAYREVARALTATYTSPGLLREAVHQSLHRPGLHAWDNLGRAQIEVGRDLYTRDPARGRDELRALVLASGGTATTATRLSAFAALRQLSPEAANEPAVMAAAAAAFRDEGQLEKAMELYRTAALSLSPSARQASALYALLTLQVARREAVSLVQQTYDLLARCNEASGVGALVRLGLLQLAQSYRDSGAAGKAAGLATEYEATYGQDAWLAGFRATSSP